MLTVDEIKQFLELDKTSVIKHHARLGQKYYEGEHDIKQYKMYYIDGNGNAQEDKYRSNIKISHPFFTELVDQQVQYMLSGDEFVKSDMPDLQAELNAYFNDEFASEMGELLTPTVSQGFSYMYAFKNEEGKTRFKACDGLGVIEVRAKEASDNADHIIYYYAERITKDNRLITHIEVWDKNNTYYYVQDDNGEVELDRGVVLNPRPHIIYTQDDSDDLFYEDLGFIPFFRLDNNRKRYSNLKPIKDIIDDYDLMSCALSNNLQDMVEGLYVVKGFAGDNLDEMIHNLKTKKAVGVDGDGDVDIRTVNIPYDARKIKLELDEKNIYRFGMGFNSAQVGDGNITNIVIKSRYALLDLKCDKLQRRLKAFLRPLIRIVLDEINEAHGSAWQESDVYIEFKREIMTNAADNALIEKTEAETEQLRVNTLLSVAAMLGDDLMIENICDALDIDYEQIKDMLPTDPMVDVEQAEADLAGTVEQ